MLFLGIDWGEHHHDLCLLDQDGMVLAARRITDGLAGIGELHALVAAHTQDPAEVAVGIETDRGPAGRGAAGRGLPGVCGQPADGESLPRSARQQPGQVRRGDAKVLADLVRTDRHNHRPVAGDSPLAEAVKVLAGRTRTWSGAGSGTPTRCAAPCGSSTPARWPRLVPSSLSRRPLRCWRWHQPPSRAGGSPGQQYGGPWSARAVAATSRPEW